ncbi:hypothetical protein [Methylocapsa acidiphila]|uniref:hypothetical protein n=1 Tax=Methylocapsa acidiphila TaxID=133552 RepID=UPI000405C5AA|nr:hypothetical protein [Methylocapsa acidiphila]
MKFYAHISDLYSPLNTKVVDPNMPKPIDVERVLIDWRIPSNRHAPYLFDTRAEYKALAAIIGSAIDIPEHEKRWKRFARKVGRSWWIDET